MDQHGQKTLRQTKEGYNQVINEHNRVIKDLVAEESELVRHAIDGQLTPVDQQRINDIHTMIRNREKEISKAEYELQNNTFLDGGKNGE